MSHGVTHPEAVNPGRDLESIQSIFVTFPSFTLEETASSNRLTEDLKST